MGLGSYEPLTIFLSTDQYRTQFSVCLCLKTPYLIDMVGSFTLNS